ncbi:MAG: AAA domain-containing protein [Thaumarchaeota archaeon]|nr:AAA domain-containing protein [Nitrososphaerota archaeon]
MGSNYHDDIIPADSFKEKLRKIPNCVRLRLNEPGQSANELTRTPGDEKQTEYKDHPIWHCKPDLDAYVKNKIGFTDEEVERKHPSGANIFYQDVAHEITKLRNSNTIVDWSSDVRTGVWRMRFSDNISSTPKTSVNMSSQKNYFIITQNPQSDYDDIPGIQYAYDSWKKYSTEFVEGTKFIVLSNIDKIDYFVGYGTVDKITSTPTVVNGRNQIKQVALFKDYVKFPVSIVRTNDVRQKMSSIAYPNSDKPNIPPSMLPIPKKFYDEIIHGSVAPTRDYNSELPMLSTPDIEEGYDLISQELLISKDKIIEIITALLSGRHVLLAGPIGTGKTRLAALIPEIFWKRWGGYASEDFTATSEWSTLDVIGGILPKIENNQPTYDIQNGCVVETVIKNSQARKDHSRYSPDKPYCGTWLVIDEFNRAEIDKAFGQLFTALRTQELKIPTNKAGKSYEDLKISDDYRIIGTLNSTDTHFLFGLSDALKSRFAYIEVGVPKRGQSETEIYYALNNALIKLKKDSSFGKIKFDHQAKKILKVGSDEKLYKKIMQAYYTLDGIRVFKKLGTAVLQLIYQNMIVGDLISVNAVTSLDNALISTVIPQIDHESSVSLNVIHALFTNNLGDFFKKQYSGINRDTYVESFKLILDYLEIPNKQNLLNLYEKNKIGKDDTVWQTIREKCRLKTDNLELNLPNWTKELDELKKSQVI